MVRQIMMLFFYIFYVLPAIRTVFCQQNSDFEIKTITGEPDYRLVNLTWSIEKKKSLSYDTIPTTTPVRAFNVFYCELQSWGPHRCKSKIFEDNHIDPNESQKQYSMIVDNLRMATKYSFHVRPQNRVPKKISGRADYLTNEENELTEPLATLTGPGQTIIIPTKGFSAHATKCLPDASEIEVETGPYFGGRIIAEGGVDCSIDGDYLSDRDRYTMRIDHNRCGSDVNSETLTVRTFITVQENLGIFTHSTRRFLVLCTYQPDTLTIRASFSVPANGRAKTKDVGVADISPIDDEWIESSDRAGRDRKFRRMVDKSSLILKEVYPDDSEDGAVVNGPGTITSNDQVQIMDKSIQDNIIDLQDNSRANYARLTNSINQMTGTLENKNFGGEYTGLIMTVSLSVILLGAVLFILRKESTKRRTITS